MIAAGDPQTARDEQVLSDSLVTSHEQGRQDQVVAYGWREIQNPRAAPTIK
jgi:hypothetical protein